MGVIAGEQDDLVQQLADDGVNFNSLTTGTQAALEDRYYDLGGYPADANLDSAMMAGLAKGDYAGAAYELAGNTTNVGN